MQSNTHTHSHTHSRTHTHTPELGQMLVEAGGKDLLMHTNNDGESCLVAAVRGNEIGVAEVRKGMSDRL